MFIKSMTAKYRLPVCLVRDGKDSVSINLLSIACAFCIVFLLFGGIYSFLSTKDNDFFKVIGTMVSSCLDGIHHLFVGQVADLRKEYDSLMPLGKLVLPILTLSSMILIPVVIAYILMHIAIPIQYLLDLVNKERAKRLSILILIASVICMIKGYLDS